MVLDLLQAHNMSFVPVWKKVCHTTERLHNLRKDIRYFGCFFLRWAVGSARQYQRVFRSSFLLSTTPIQNLEPSSNSTKIQIACRHPQTSSCSPYRYGIFGVTWPAAVEMLVTLSLDRSVALAWAFPKEVVTNLLALPCWLPHKHSHTIFPSSEQRSSLYLLVLIAICTKWSSLLYLFWHCLRQLSTLASSRSMRPIKSSSTPRTLTIRSIW